MKVKYRMLIVEDHPLLRVMQRAAGCVHASLRAGADGYILESVERRELRVATGSERSEKHCLSRCFLTQMISRRLMAFRELFSALRFNASAMTMTVVI